MRATPSFYVFHIEILFNLIFDCKNVLCRNYAFAIFLFNLNENRDPSYLMICIETLSVVE